MALSFRPLALLSCFLAGCSPQRFFYYPNRHLYTDPDQLGIRNQIVHYPSLNGNMLYALFLPATGESKGTVVHFHGNFGNLSNHFPLALFWTRYGYDVLSFDYQGYGASAGRPTPEHMVDDGMASVRYAAAHLRNPRGGVFIFGQSLGGAVGIVVMAKEPLVKAGIFEAPFASYRSQAGDVIRRHWFLFPFYVLVPFLNHRDDPLRWIHKISPRPILLIHGTADTIVSPKMSKRLFDAAGEPKELWLVPGAGHLQCHRADPDEYEKKVVGFFNNIKT